MAAINEEIIVENEKALTAFANGEEGIASPVLSRVLDQIKQTGVPYYPWPQLRALLVAKLKISLDSVHTSDKSSVVVGWSPTNKNKYEERRENVAAQLDAFDAPPFTLQRLTEVILEPHKTYKSLNKLFNALEKLLAVSSTILVVDPRAQTPPQDDDSEPPAPPTITIQPMAAPTPQVVQGNTELDVVARAPWSDGSS